MKSPGADFLQASASILCVTSISKPSSSFHDGPGTGRNYKWNALLSIYRNI